MNPHEIFIKRSRKKFDTIQNEYDEDIDHEEPLEVPTIEVYEYNTNGNA